jgi:WD40 repeat protein
LDDYGANITAVAFSPDGKSLATALVHGDIEIRRTITVHIIGAISGCKTFISGIAFSPDGRLLATITRSKACLL